MNIIKQSREHITLHAQINIANCCLWNHDSLSDITHAQMQEVSDLDQEFESARHNLKAGEPAAAFTCPLTVEVFRDPVMTPSGLSYERSALVEHLRKV